MLNLFDFLAVDAAPEALLRWGLGKLALLAAALVALAAVTAAMLPV